MQQSNVIFANLLIAYLIFIVMRGELATYITLLRGGGPSPNNQGNDSPNNSFYNGVNQLVGAATNFSSGFDSQVQAFTNGLSTTNTTDLFNMAQEAPSNFGNDANLLSIIGG
jgi:hypothetical protein